MYCIHYEKHIRTHSYYMLVLNVGQLFELLCMGFNPKIINCIHYEKGIRKTSFAVGKGENWSSQALLFYRDILFMKNCVSRNFIFPLCNCEPAYRLILLNQSKSSSYLHMISQTWKNTLYYSEERICNCSLLDTGFLVISSVFSGGKTA